MNKKQLFGVQNWTKLPQYAVKPSYIPKLNASMKMIENFMI